MVETPEELCGRSVKLALEFIISSSGEFRLGFQFGFKIQKHKKMEELYSMFFCAGGEKEENETVCLMNGTEVGRKTAIRLC